MKTKKEAREAIKNDISSLLSWAQNKKLALKKQPNMYSLLRSELTKDEDVKILILKKTAELKMKDSKCNYKDMIGMTPF